MKDGSGLYARLPCWYLGMQAFLGEIQNNVKINQ